MTILTCPHCGGTITRDFDVKISLPVEVNFGISLKCPHCKAVVKVEMKYEVVRTIRINGKWIRDNIGESKEDKIRTL